MKRVFTVLLIILFVYANAQNSRLQKCKTNSECPDRTYCMNRENRAGDESGWCTDNNGGQRQCLTADDCETEKGKGWFCNLGPAEVGFKPKTSEYVRPKL